MAANTAKMVLFTEERYAVCQVWQALAQVFPHDLVALPRHQMEALRFFSEVRSLWYRAPEGRDYLAEVERLRDGYPHCQVLVILPQLNREAAANLYERGVDEVLSVQDFTLGTEALVRLDLSLAYRWQRALRHRSREDALQKAVERKREQLDWLSHEIRTPMNGLMGMLEILRGFELGPDQLELIDVMARCTRKITDLLTETLDRSRMELGKMPVHCHSFDLQQLIEDSLQLHARDANARGIVMGNWMDHKVPTRLLGDERKLTQIINNLLSNAVKYTREGHVLVAVHGEDVQATSCVVRIEITDTGYGMSPEELETVFAPFVQTRSHELSQQEGSGMGMTFVQRLVELLGGRIRLQSQEGQGTTVELALPFRVAETSDLPRLHRTDPPSIAIVGPRSERTEMLGLLLRADDLTWAQVEAQDPLPRAEVYFFSDAMAWQAAHSARDTLRGSSKSFILRNPMQEKATTIDGPDHSTFLDLPLRQSCVRQCLLRGDASQPTEPRRVRSQDLRPQARILVVDDDLLNLRVAKKQLRHLAAHVGLARSGNEALQLLETEQFDLIFVDFHMPDMNGLELVRHLRDRAAADVQVPLIALTGRTRLEDRAKILADGFDDLLPKPADGVDMAKMLDKWLPSSKSAKMCT